MNKSLSYSSPTYHTYLELFITSRDSGIHLVSFSFSLKKFLIFQVCWWQFFCLKKYISPSFILAFILKKIFTGDRIWGWQYFFFVSTLKMSCRCLLTCTVSDEMCMISYLCSSICTVSFFPSSRFFSMLPLFTGFQQFDCLRVVFFGVILLRVHWAFWIC